MAKILLRMMAVVIAVTLVWGAPPAYAIFGIRAARTVMAARKAKQMTSSDAEAHKPSAEEKAGFEGPLRRKLFSKEDVNRNSTDDSQ